MKMSTRYSFFRDDLALNEIRKHKWIESEKKGEDIGFATAALDWIRRYGNAWKQFCLGLNDPQRLLVEKRHYRRFPCRFPIQLTIDENTNLECRTDNISLIGLCCTVPSSFPHNASTEVIIRFWEERTPIPKWRFQFKSRIARVKKLATGADPRYHIFIPFTEEVRDYLRCNSTYLSTI